MQKKRTVAYNGKTWNTTFVSEGRGERSSVNLSSTVFIITLRNKFRIVSESVFLVFTLVKWFILNKKLTVNKM